MTGQRSRLGIRAAAIVAGLALAAAYAGPAYAATLADVEMKFVGTTMAPGSESKVGTFSVVNHGPGDAFIIAVGLNISALDTTKIEVDVPEPCSIEEGPSILCFYPELSAIKVDEDFDGGWTLIRKPGATGEAGQVTAFVITDTIDPDQSNNRITVDVKISDIAGPDLSTLAQDVYQDTDSAPGEPGPDQPIPPGGTSNLWVLVTNQGDLAANGVNMSITLPDHVSFSEPEPSCSHGAGDTTTTCAYDTVILTPTGDDALGTFFFPVKVAADAPGPAALTDGTVSVEAMSAGEPSTEAQHSADLPRNFSRAVPPELADVDPTDNTDEFTVFVAGPPGLPVTGAQAGLIGFAGAAMVLVGIALVLTGRRRRTAAAHVVAG